MKGLGNGRVRVGRSAGVVDEPVRAGPDANAELRLHITCIEGIVRVLEGDPETLQGLLVALAEGKGLVGVGRIPDEGIVVERSALDPDLRTGEDADGPVVQAGDVQGLCRHAGR